jgi:serine protease Do
MPTMENNENNEINFNELNSNEITDASGAEDKMAGANANDENCSDVDNLGTDVSNENENTYKNVSSDESENTYQSLNSIEMDQLDLFDEPAFQSDEAIQAGDDSKNYFEGDESPKEDDNSKSQIFYKENCKKTKRDKRFGLIQLIAVALVSSIIGGSVVGGVLVFAGSTLRPADSSILSSLTPGTSGSNDQYTKVVIDSSGSPVSAIAQKVNKSIVGIKVTFDSTDFFSGTQQGTGEGSGIIIKSDGYIMTNNHVIADALDSTTGAQTSTSKIQVILPSNINKSYTAKIVGRDEKTDLAVLKIDATGLPTAELGDSDTLKVGELAVAIGNPGGLDYMGSVTVGVISGLNRTISPEDPTLKLIQTDAAINPGNSGGALINSKGQVIGINSAKIVATGFEGLGFAIPINTAKGIVDSLLTSGYVKGRPFLGIEQNVDYTSDVAKQNNLPEGVLVDSVIPLSGAYKAGIQRGDIITKFDGIVIKDFNSLNDAKNKHKPNDTVPVEVYRNGKTLKFNVTLTEQKN